VPISGVPRAGERGWAAARGPARCWSGTDARYPRPVYARHQDPKVNAKVADTHDSIPRKDFRVVADAVCQTAATRDLEVR
jgi:hypothetical protein